MASPGIELLFNSIKAQIKAPQDSILCVLHWQVVSAGYKCIGIGEKKTKNDDETEMLPDGWNVTPDLYVLRYKSGTTGAVYVLKVIAVDNVLLTHFWKNGEEKVATMNIIIDDYATDNYTTYKRALHNVNDLCKAFKREILDEFKPASPRAGTSRKGSNSRTTVEEDPDPLRVPGTGSHRHRPQPEWAEPDDPFSVGRSDLDPLGRGMGGMMFDPMRQGRGPRFGMDPSAGLPSRLPRGAVPPGARFDPFGPPGTHPGQRPGPDPDHMRPPDYDDMFM